MKIREPRVFYSSFNALYRNLDESVNDIGFFVLEIVCLLKYEI